MNTKILFFSSSTCGPCCLAKNQLTEQTIKELNVEIVTDNDWETFVIHEVQSVPTFIKINLESNEEINRVVGFKSIEELRSL